MNAKQLITIATLAFAGTAAQADDITIVKDSFVPMQTRAAVRAEVLKARAAGVAQFATEFDAQLAPAAPAAASTLTREQVRSELRNAPRNGVVTYDPIA